MGSGNAVVRAISAWVAFLLIWCASSASAAENGDTWQPPARYYNSDHLNYYVSTYEKSDSVGSSIIQCPPNKSDGCTLAKQGTLVFPVCEASAETNCIESLILTSADRTATFAKFTEYTGGARTQSVLPFKVDSKINLTKPGTMSLWRVEPKVAGEVRQLAVSVSTMATLDEATGLYAYSGLAIGVYPYRIKPDNRIDFTPYCVFRGNVSCAIQKDFEVGDEITISIRASKSIGGWFHGRVVEPKITTTTLSADTQRLQIGGAVASVPAMDTAVLKSSATEQQLQLDPNLKSDIAAGHFYASDDPALFQVLNAYRQLSKDSIAGRRVIWTIYSLPGGYEQYYKGGPECLKNRGVAGIVSTDALAYDKDIPSYSNNQLRYRVAGLHFEPDGKTEVTGHYSLVMNGQVARCLFGLSNLPISATAVIINSDGQTKTATYTFGEKDGWLHFDASGFTFSSNEIALKISQLGGPRKVTITCAKKSNAKVTKRITGVKPSCPSGYRPLP